MNLGLLPPLGPHLRGQSLVEDNDAVIQKEIEVRDVHPCPNVTSTFLVNCFSLFTCNQVSLNKTSRKTKQNKTPAPAFKPGIMIKPDQVETSICYYFSSLL